MTPQFVGELHALFCRATGRSDRLCITNQRLWFELSASPAYRDQPAELRRDVGFVAWYLRWAIGQDKRNPGALKLVNFLNPQQFDADLQEGRMVRPKAWAAHCAKVAGAVAPAAAVKALALTTDDGREDALRAEVVRGIRALREQLGGATSAEVDALPSANPKALPERRES